jgi:hypothetical protein
MEIICSIVVNGLKDYVPLIAALAAVAGLFFTSHTIKKNTSINAGLFLIKFKNFFNDDEKVKIYHKINKNKSLEDNEWHIVDDYMGMFEIMYKMVHEGVLKKKDVNDLFKYRIIDIMKNKSIFFNRLIAEYKYWKNFYYLLADVLNDNSWKDLYKVLENDKQFNGNLEKHVFQDGKITDIKDIESDMMEENSIIQIQNFMERYKKKLISCNCDCEELMSPTISGRY